MTYKELVDRLKDIAFRHKQIVDFGYGELSDIKVKSQDNGDGSADNTDYPYMFLNPSQHTRTERTITYRFNMIMMDLCNADATNTNVLQIQSDCLQYIDDVLADLKFEYADLDIEINVSLTPFKERFQDTVAGMTAALVIELPNPLNRCIAPINE